jgi:hypothetical protein
MRGKLDRLLRREWPRWGFGPAPDRLSALLLPGSVRPDSKLVFLYWAGAEPDPRVVVKAPRRPDENRRLIAERVALEQVARFAPAGPPRAPRGLGGYRVDGLEVLVETVAPGRALRARLREEPRRAAATVAAMGAFAAWITGLHAASARPATAEEMTMLALAPLAPGALPAATPGERAGLARLEARAAVLAARAPLPLVFNHNDAGPPNVLVDRQGAFCGVLDWESGGWGLPGADLLYFVARLAEDVIGDDRYPARAFCVLFFGGVARGALPMGLARDWLAAYCRRLDVDPAWTPALLALTWIMHARNEAAQRLAAGREGPGPFRRQLEIYLTNWEASVFGGGDAPS